MTSRLRCPSLWPCLAVLLLPLLGSGAGSGSDPAPQDPQPAGRPHPDSAASCGSCHVDFHEEWKGRAHSRAWTDPVYQAQLQEKTRPRLCHGCHIPAEVHDRLGRKPRTRDHLLEEGVTCVSCHKSGDDILGPFGAETDAHPSVKSAVFDEGSVATLCNSCHETKIGPVLPVGRDHQDEYVVALGDEAKSCVECHMPEIERHLAVSPVTGKPVGEKRRTRSHRILGPGDPDFAAKAFDIAVEPAGDALEVTVRNGAGHRVPGLRELRQFVLTVRQVDAGGGELARHEEVFDGDDNPLRVLEERQLDLPRAEGVSRVAITVDHVFQGEKVATVLERTTEL